MSIELSNIESVPFVLVTASVAARMLSISTRTLWTLTKRGEIPVRRIGRSVRYFVPDLIEWAKKGRA